MEIPKNDQIQPSSTVSVCSDWDLDFTDEELQSIDAAIESAASSSSSKKSVANCDGDRPRTRRRLPDSLFTRSALSFNSSSVDPSDNIKTRYPAMAFKGHIVYSRTFPEVEKAADELLKFVELKKKDGGRAIIGFDVEWRPSFRKGVKQGKAAVLQICADAASCHVMHVIHSGFPESLKSLLGDSKSVKVGVGIAGDARKVFNDHNVSVDGLEDLSYLANQKLGREPKNWSLSSLTEALTCKEVPKPSKIRLGNWEANPLSKEQLNYAATDAFVSWHLFEVLNRLPDVDTLTNEVVEEAIAPS
ncbi:unnamed protein product [Lactuca saligna]|uniref:3'-5' exonuclease n=1 Tax=Lactuca saligna TaxID=75948 RepID=A0AA35VSL6_LACSI|nr:unnamed protein product [Lactuca saligna]